MADDRFGNSASFDFFYALDAIQVFKSYTIWNHPWHQKIKKIKKIDRQEEPDSTENTDKNYHIKFL